MHLLDPKGMSNRQNGRRRRRQYSSPGPNFVFHIDSYDKRKPHGITVNGCIDAFSRCIIWLEAANTNGDQKVKSSYYLDSIRKRGGCPKRFRTDHGTENIYSQQMQMFFASGTQRWIFLRREFSLWKSTHNQRIEWFWNCFEKKWDSISWICFRSWVRTWTTYIAAICWTKVWFCFLDIIQVIIF